MNLRRRKPAPGPTPEPPAEAAVPVVGNPLCVGAHCDICGTRLEIRNGEPKPCPMGPHEDGAA